MTIHNHRHRATCILQFLKEIVLIRTVDFDTSARTGCLAAVDVEPSASERIRRRIGIQRHTVVAPVPRIYMFSEKSRRRNLAWIDRVSSWRNRPNIVLCEVRAAVATRVRIRSCDRTIVVVQNKHATTNTGDSDDEETQGVGERDRIPPGITIFIHPTSQSDWVLRNEPPHCRTVVGVVLVLCDETAIRVHQAEDGAEAVAEVR